MTGQISSHARHVVHAHTSSAVMRSNNELAPILISESTDNGGVTEPCRAVAAMTSPVFKTISRGSSDLPVACAGHTLVQRPHMVHESVSRSCFQVKSSTTEAPKVSREVSVRFGMARIAPFGRSRSLRYMFSGDVKMWRNIVSGSNTRKPMNATTCNTHIAWCQFSSEFSEAPSTSCDNG